GQTRLPTFSMKRRSKGAGRHSARARSIIRASRWQVPPVVIWRTGKPKRRRRAASFSVWMSPVSTATRAPAGKAASVRSSSVVLPEPGELIRFRQSTPWAANRRRNSAAMRSFSLRTLRSSGTWLILLQFQRSYFQLVAARKSRLGVSAPRTSQVVVRHRKCQAASRAALPARAALDLKLQRFQFALSCQHLKAEAERLRVHPRKLPHAQPYLPQARSRMALGLLARLLQYRSRDAQFVHKRLSRCAAVGRPPACPQSL